MELETFSARPRGVAALRRAIALAATVAIAATSFALAGATAPARAADAAPSPSPSPAAVPDIPVAIPTADGAQGSQGRGADTRGDARGANGAPGAPGLSAGQAADAFILGKVSLPSGAAMDGFVDVYAKGGGYLGSVSPAGDGTFSIGVSAGKFLLAFTGFTGAANEWYDNDSTYGSATSVTATAAGKNIGTVKLGVESTISGAFSYDASWGDDICVVAWNWSDDYFESSYCGARGSTFTLPNLQPGSYYLEFFGSDSGDEYYPGGKVSVGTAEHKWLQWDDIVAELDFAGYLQGETMTITLDTGNQAFGTATVQSKTGSSWSNSGATIAVVDGEGSTELPYTVGASYRVNFGGVTSNEITPSTWVASPVVEVPDTYVSNTPFDVTVWLSGQGNGKAALKQRVNGGTWKTVKGGITIVNGVGTRALTRTSGDTVEFYATFSGENSPIDTITRQYRNFGESGTADYFKGQTVEIGWDIDPVFTGTTKLWVKKGSNSWKKSKTKVVFEGGAVDIDVKPSAKTQRYQLRIGADRSVPIVLTRVKPELTLSFGEGDDGDHALGTDFDLVVLVEAPEGADAAPYTGKVTLKQRKPGGSWSKVSGGIDVVEGEGIRTLTQTKLKREYKVEFGGSKSNVIRATGFVAPV